MNAVKFGLYHSYKDLGIVLSSKSIEAPETKTNIIEIPGADGSLDFTEYFGEPKYKNRTLIFNFSMIGTGEYQLTHYSYIKNLLHGQRMKIILDADANFYYVGRLSVSGLSTTKNINTFSVTCDCDPYKYKANKTIIVNDVSDNPILIYMNMRKSVVPTITVTEQTQFTFENTVYMLEPGTYTDDNIVFKAGNNTFYNVEGTGTITVEYQEGSL